MANLKAILLTVVLASSAGLVSGCASKLGYGVAAARNNPPPAPSAPAAKLEGKIGVTDGSSVDLGGLSDLPTVLVFSQDTCAVCAHEADTLRSSLHNPGVAPARVHLVTILVGAILEDAQDWQQAHRIPWTVGIDTDASLFEHYCAARTVPCNVVFMPGQGVVLSRNGAMSRSDLVSITGEWENL